MTEELPEDVNDDKDPSLSDLLTMLILKKPLYCTSVVCAFVSLLLVIAFSVKFFSTGDELSIVCVGLGILVAAMSAFIAQRNT